MTPNILPAAPYGRHPIIGRHVPVDEVVEVVVVVREVVVVVKAVVVVVVVVPEVRDEDDWAVVVGPPAELLVWNVAVPVV